MNNLHPEMTVYLQGVNPITFEELTSKAADVRKLSWFLN